MASRSTTPRSPRLASVANGAKSAGMAFSSIGAESPREVLFSLDGTDYTIATQLPVSKGLEYVRLGVEVSTDVALLYALRTALGEDGFTALRNAADITQQDFQTVVDACMKVMLGSMSAPKDPQSKD